MTINLGKLGGQLGVLLCLLGFLAIFLGWNGAAGKNTPMSQFPFLISGGVAGLAIVVVGAASLIVQSAREDRARLEATIERLAAALEQGGRSSVGSVGGHVAGVAGLNGVNGHGGHAAPSGADAGLNSTVIASSTSYHRLDCTLTASREEARPITLLDALGASLTPCRVCKPPALTAGV